MNLVFDFLSFPALTTQRLKLRQIRQDDAEAMTVLFGRPEMLRFLNLSPVDTVEKAKGLIDWLHGNYQKGEGIDWGITLADDDRLVGMCGAANWDRSNRHIDLGYHIASAYWGKGYATEAARAVCRWCFDNLDVHRIQADCTDGNIGSERVLLKCGFTVEGVWRESCWEHERFVDIKQFGLLRREFNGG